MPISYDAVLVVAFGGPEQTEDVMPFLENVTRGRSVPRERLLEVAEHYHHFGGVSPINDQVRELIAALRHELDRNAIHLPIYWGNRNWHPLLPDTIRNMSDDGVKHALGLVLAAYSSYSSCRQYLENIDDARQTIGAAAPRVDKIRVFYNHPRFVSANTARVSDALQQIPSERRRAAHVAYTAHSIPNSMAEKCEYEQQLTETCRLVSEQLGTPKEQWRLVYQSRSGRPSDPWLEPDVVDHLKTLKQQSIEDVVVMPIGFLSDHLEVLFDLDEEAQAACREMDLNMVRAATAGTHPEFVAMLRELIQERHSEDTNRACIGQFGPGHDFCDSDCCPAARRLER